MSNDECMPQTVSKLTSTCADVHTPPTSLVFTPLTLQRPQTSAAAASADPIQPLVARVLNSRSSCRGSSDGDTS
eukprot:4746060-Prymnesium_polylepis.2